MKLYNHLDDRKAATNSTYPKDKDLCSKDSFEVNQIFVFQIKFCGKSPALMVAANRYRLFGSIGIVEGIIDHRLNSGNFSLFD